MQKNYSQNSLFFNFVLVKQGHVLSLVVVKQAGIELTFLNAYYVVLLAKIEQDLLVYVKCCTTAIPKKLGCSVKH